jgi:hypothetical protein
MLSVNMLKVVAPLSLAAVETFFCFVKARWLSRLKVHLHWRCLLPKTHATATEDVLALASVGFESVCCSVVAVAVTFPVAVVVAVAVSVSVSVAVSVAVAVFWQAFLRQTSPM